jgi:hypothetical protein
MAKTTLAIGKREHTIYGTSMDFAWGYSQDFLTRFAAHVLAKADKIKAKIELNKDPEDTYQLLMDELLDKDGNVITDDLVYLFFGADGNMQSRAKRLHSWAYKLVGPEK